MFLSLLLVIASRSLADGPPVVEPLVYRGVAFGPSGAPMTGTINVSLTLFTAETGGLMKCTTTRAGLPLEPQGRFKLPLSSQCSSDISQNPELWMEIAINGEPLGRTKLAATPYALEARRATQLVMRSEDGGVTTTEGSFCGVTPTSTTAQFQAGGLVGYRAAKFMCEQACGKRTAHFCSTLEAIRAHEFGVDLPRGWLKNGAAASGQLGTTSWVYTECNGWFIGTTNFSGNNYAGPIWAPATSTSNAAPSNDGCGTSLPLLCCD